MRHRWEIPSSRFSSQCSSELPKAAAPTALAVAVVFSNTHQNDQAKSDTIVAVVSGLTDGGLLIWTLKPSALRNATTMLSGEVRRSPAVHAGPVTSIVVGRSIPIPVMEPGFWLTLFTASVDRTIKQWHVILNQREITANSVVRTIYGNSSAITSMALFPKSGNRHIVSGCSDGSLTLWTAQPTITGPASHTPDAPLRYPAYDRATTLVGASRKATSWVASMAVHEGDVVKSIFCGMSNGHVQVVEVDSRGDRVSSSRDAEALSSPIRKLLLLSDCGGGLDMIDNNTLFAIGDSYSIVGLNPSSLERMITLDIPHQVLSSSSRLKRPAVEARDSGCVMASFKGQASSLLLGASEDGFCVYDVVNGCTVQCDTAGLPLGEGVDPR